MIEIKRILCPVDFSEFSRHAVECAGVLARWYESEISLLYVQPMPMAAAIPYGGPVVVDRIVLPAEERERFQKDLEQFAQPLVDAGIPISVHVADGSAVDRILALAGEKQADLIVMGTHGRSGFERLLLGSVAERILRKAACPVLTVPPRVSGVTAPPAFKRILCAVDFSAPSLRGLEYALSLAQEADAALTLAHVLEFMPEEEMPDLPGFDVREYAASIAASARERLAAAVPADARTYCEIQEVVATGRPWREILRLARDGAADLIVMGVRGRGAADLVLFGSTTQHVVRQATCPVLTLRTQR
jgi:nucleotide-binding universal stress UspA family protein